MQSLHDNHAIARHSYRADIDGLRCVAVLAVMFFHAGIGPLTGGYVGVDVFFVISGFLITRTVADEVAAGRFSYAAFYERRARRILPALFVVLSASTIFALLLMSPAELTRYAPSLAAATLGVSNMLFRAVSLKNGYFDDDAPPQMLLHTWSLGVEEQFYLLMPPILLLLWRLSSGRRWVCLLALATASFAWATYTLSYKPSYTFYVVFPRAWELLAGSLLALRLDHVSTGHLPSLVQRRSAPLSRGLRECVAVASLGAILLAIFGFTRTTSFPGPAALLPVLGTCGLIWSGGGAAGRPTAVARLLTMRPVVYLGLISYSLYLWHWPLLEAARILHPFGPTRAPRIAALVVSLLCASLSYAWVEQPFRRKRIVASRRGVFAAATMVSVLAVAGSIACFGGLPDRFAERTVAALDANGARARDNALGDCINFRKPLKSANDVALCPLGGSGVRKVAFVGDSHIAQLRPLVAQLYREGTFGGRDVIFPVSAGCVLSTKMNLSGNIAFCPTAMRLAHEIVSDDRVDTVLIGFSAWFENVVDRVCLVDDDGRCQRNLRPLEVAEGLAQDLAETVRSLRSRGKAVIVMLPLPSYDRPIPEAEIRAATMRARHLDWLADLVLGDLHRSDFPTTRRLLREAVEAAGAIIYDPRADLCEGNTCRFAVDGVSLYSDDTHLAGSQVGVFHDRLDALFRGLYASNATGVPVNGGTLPNAIQPSASTVGTVTASATSPSARMPSPTSPVGADSYPGLSTSRSLGSAQAGNAP